MVAAENLPELRRCTIVSSHGSRFWNFLWCNAGRYRLVALDMRGHGETVTDDDQDLSSDTLSKVPSALLNLQKLAMM